jgi:CSLREA domain-containing protein
MGARFITAPLCLAAAMALFVVPAGAATIEVTITDDELNADADCSLREAVQAASTNSAVSGCAKGQAGKRDTIILVPGEAHQLGPTIADEDQNANGDLDLRPGGGPLTIKGNARGMGGPDIVAPDNNRAIESVSGSSALKILKLNLEGGDVSTSATGDTGGGVVEMMDAPLTLKEVNVQGGTATRGGGVRVKGGNTKIIGSFIGSNAATITGGGINVPEANLLKLVRSGVGSNDVVGDEVNGAGVFSAADRTQVIDTEIQFNNLETTSSDGVAHGGGIYTTSETFEMRRSLVQANSSEDVGGASSSFGAGVDSLGTKIEIVNSTLFGNDTDGTGGAIYAWKGTVSHVTFAQNSAADAGDYMAGPLGGGTTKIRNSILPGPLGFTDLCAGAPGEFVSKGYSVIEFDDSACGFLDSDAVVADVGFADGTPVPNGGETFTMGIEKTSPARNLIPRRKCKVAQKEDQRDFKRPRGRKCDAGAFEFGAKET